MTPPMFLPLPGNGKFAVGLAGLLGGEVGRIETRRFPDGETYLRLRSTSKLINQQDSPFVTVPHKILHVGQMGRIGTQVILNTLFVAYVYEQMGKYAHAGAFVHRHQ